MNVARGVECVDPYALTKPSALTLDMNPPECLENSCCESDVESVTALQTAHEKEEAASDVTCAKQEDCTSSAEVARKLRQFGAALQAKADQSQLATAECRRLDVGNRLKQVAAAVKAKAGEGSRPRSATSIEPVRSLDVGRKIREAAGVIRAKAGKQQPAAALQNQTQESRLRSATVMPPLADVSARLDSAAKKAAVAVRAKGASRHSMTELQNQTQEPRSRSATSMPSISEGSICDDEGNEHEHEEPSSPTVIRARSATSLPIPVDTSRLENRHSWSEADSEAQKIKAASAVQRREKAARKIKQVVAAEEANAAASGEGVRPRSTTSIEIKPTQSIASDVPFLRNTQ